MRTNRVVKILSLASLAALLGAGHPSRAQQPLKLLPISACGGYDTRQPGGPTGGLPLQSGTAYSFTFQGASCVPYGATALALYVIAINPTGPGYLQVYPAGTAAPNIWLVTFDGPSSGAIGVQVIVPLASTATPDITVLPTVAGAAPNNVHLLIDVQGIFE
jgi:hypothetical protein